MNKAKTATTIDTRNYGEMALFLENKECITFENEHNVCFTLSLSEADLLASAIKTITRRAWQDKTTKDYKLNPDVYDFNLDFEEVDDVPKTK